MKKYQLCHYLFYFPIKGNTEQELLEIFDLLTPNYFGEYITILLILFLCLISWKLVTVSDRTLLYHIIKT